MEDPSVEVALRFFDSARSEMMARIELRETSLLAYLAAVGAVVGAAVQAKNALLVAVVPFLGLSIAILQLHHNGVIGAIVRYLTKEVGPVLAASGSGLKDYENSDSRRDFVRFGRWHRFVGELILIVLPSLLSTIVVSQARGLGPHRLAVLSGSWICVLASTLCVFEVLRQRVKNLRRDNSKQLPSASSTRSASGA
jgi:hypothetical protein